MSRRGGMPDPSPTNVRLCGDRRLGSMCRHVLSSPPVCVFQSEISPLVPSAADAAVGAHAAAPNQDRDILEPLLDPASSLITTSPLVASDTWICRPPTVAILCPSGLKITCVLGSLCPRKLPTSSTELASNRRSFSPPVATYLPSGLYAATDGDPASSATFRPVTVSHMAPSDTIRVRPVSNRSLCHLLPTEAKRSRYERPRPLSCDRCYLSQPEFHLD